MDSHECVGLESEVKDFKEHFLNRIKNEYSPDVMDEYKQNGVLKEFVPDIDEMDKVGRCPYHVVDSYTHSIITLKELEKLLRNEDFFPPHLKKWVDHYLVQEVDGIRMKELVKLGAFFHDVGKFKSKSYKANGQVTFKGHAYEGSLIVKDFAERLQMTENLQRILVNFVLYHMMLLNLYKDDDLSKSRLYEKFEEVGDDSIGILIIGYVDLVATRKLLFDDETREILKSYLVFSLTSYFYRFQGRMTV